MRLYIIRHAIAAPAEETGAEADSQRPLTPKGRKKMVRIARGLRELEKRLDLILTSPYLRAIQTAEILRQTYDLDPAKVISTEHLIPMGFPDQLIEEIQTRYTEAQHIALVGHEPYLSELVSLLTTGEPHLALTLKKGGVCRLSVDALHYERCATLDWALFPSHLIKIGKKA